MKMPSRLLITVICINFLNIYADNELEVPILQPGSPGESSIEISSETAINIANSSYTKDDIMFMQGMIIHHHQATVMSKLAPTNTNNKSVLKLAGRIDVSQKDEISFMKDWLNEREQDAPDPKLGHVNDKHQSMHGMASSDEIFELTESKGTKFDKLFLKLMIAHHDGALKMVKELKDQPGSAYDPALSEFVADIDIFKKYKYIDKYIEEQVMFYAYLNSGLSIYYNGKKYHSKQGLKDLLIDKTKNYRIVYPLIHIKDVDIEFSITHSGNYGEEHYSFVNGQHTVNGGTHLTAFKESIVRTVRDFYKKDFDVSDIRASIVTALSIRLQNPVFESQTKNKLGSTDMGPEGPTIKVFINSFLKRKLDNFLHRNPETANLILNKILQSEKERKDIAGIKKLAKQKTKKANLHNKKLRDCKFHFNDPKVDIDIKNNTMLFITEGDSASGSITKTRDVKTQAVFSLRGKPLNSFGLTKKIVYQNEEFNLLQHALNIEDGIDNLRYNKIIIATDADVDGMHIRLLILTFFLQFYPELVRNGHVYILDTPLFRVRNKSITIYAYTEIEKDDAISKISGKIEITRFKGLGEISPDEFKDFISENIRLEPVVYSKDESLVDVLTYYMGKNTQERQKFIIDNLNYEAV